MAYTRTNWVSGETPLSAGNMNNIEDGIEELNSNVEKAILMRGTVPNGTNLNNLKTIGIHQLSANYSYQNLPSGVTYGVFLVFSSSPTGSVIQINFTTNHIYWRFYDGSSWRSWITI